MNYKHVVDYRQIERYIVLHQRSLLVGYWSRVVRQELLIDELDGFERVLRASAESRGVGSGLCVRDRFEILKRERERERGWYAIDMVVHIVEIGCESFSRP